MCDFSHDFLLLKTSDLKVYEYMRTEDSILMNIMIKGSSSCRAAFR